MTPATSAVRPSSPGQPAAVLGQPAALVAPDLLRVALRHHAKGVTVITAGAERPAGFCATSLTSVSLDPPYVSFTVSLGSGSWATVETAEHIMIHLLADGQEDVARRFAQPGTAKFEAATRWRRGPYDLPVLDDVLAWLAVRPVGHVPIADHALVIGQVKAVHTADGGGHPLIHHNGGFTRLRR